MRKTYFLPLLFMLSLFTSGTFAQQKPMSKDTHEFAQRGDQSLLLDLYYYNQTGEAQPCVLFVFGGAFARGARDMEKYVPYFQYLVDHGYTVASIDYRLGLKGTGGAGDFNEEQFVGGLINAITIATEDLIEATCFLINHADIFNVDTDRIVTNGSSAGAVTVLQAEYAICNGSPLASVLPEGFRYAGVISWAGAILSLDGDLTWPVKPAPMLLMHGDADLQVPYDKMTIGNMGLYGAHHIAGMLERIDTPYYFYSFENFGHEIASNPLNDDRELVLYFLGEWVEKKRPLKVNATQSVIGKPQVRKDFEIIDYIRGNYGN